MQKKCHVCNGTGLITVPIGERIRAAREERGETQEYLAQQVGISRPALANIEMGRQDVPTVKLVAIARYLGVSTDYLLGM